MKPTNDDRLPSCDGYSAFPIPPPPDESRPITARVQIELPASIANHELIEEIGRGGMGIVYRARQRALSRDVALKMLRGDGELSGFNLRTFGRRLPFTASITDVFATSSRGRSLRGICPEVGLQVYPAWKRWAFAHLFPDGLSTTRPVPAATSRPRVGSAILPTLPNVDFPRVSSVLTLLRVPFAAPPLAEAVAPRPRAPAPRRGSPQAARSRSSCSRPRSESRTREVRP